MADRDWAEVSMEFRSAVYRALEGGMTVEELHSDVDEAAEEAL